MAASLLDLSALQNAQVLDRIDASVLNIRNSAVPNAIEATVAFQVDHALSNICEEVNFAYIPQKEEGVRFRSSMKRGRMDSRIGSVVIEYKRPSQFKTERLINKATKQLIEYMKVIVEDTKSSVCGFVTDGNKFREVRLDPDATPAISGVSSMNRDAVLRMVQSLASLDLTALTSKNLIKDFCGPNKDGVLIGLAKVLYQKILINPTPKTTMLRSEWEELFRLGHDDRSQQKRIQDRRASLSALYDTRLDQVADEYLALFALHTAYAIVVKFVAYRVVCDLRFGQRLRTFAPMVNDRSTEIQSFCASLEDGEIFRRLGIMNLLEGDFFSWYCDDLQWDEEISEGMQQIFQTLSRYENTALVFASSTTMDLFRELYEATVPSQVRSSFGEFYTPTWLAHAVLNTANVNDNSRILDPCAGSGTFLVVAIEHFRNALKSLPNNEVLARILHQVVGLDLNPLAVLTARVNYFIHIADLIPDAPELLVLPVYLGDACSLPERIPIQDVPCLKINLKTLLFPLTVTLPVAFIQDRVKFVGTMLEYEKAIQAGQGDGADKIITSALAAESTSPMLSILIRSFTTHIADLEAKGWNGIWARIATNFLITGCLGHFDAIIGNPPWVDWKNLPTGYREKIKSICVDRGLFSGDGLTGGINLNVCALISHVSMTNWLADTGKLCFLMPRELTVQQSYQGWRNLRSMPPRYFEAFQDWSASGHPFNPVKEDFFTYIIGPAKADNNKIPVTTYKKISQDRSQAHRWQSLPEALTHLEKHSGVAGQVSDDSTAFTFASDERKLKQYKSVAGKCSYIGREGIEFYPQELQIFHYVGQGPASNLVFLENIQREKSKYKVSQRKVLLEKEYLFPLVKGSSIKPFGHDYQNIVVPFPYLESDHRRPISAEALAVKSPLLLAYYREHSALIKA